MPIPVKFVADVAAVKQALADIRSDAANVSVGGSASSAPASGARAGTPDASAILNRGGFTSASMAGKTPDPVAERGFGNRLNAAVQAVSAPGGSAALLQTMTTGNPYGGSIVSPMASGAGWAPSGWPGGVGSWAQPAPAAGNSFWNNVAGLGNAWGQGQAPAGFWSPGQGGQPQPLTPPPYNPPASAPASPPWWKYSPASRGAYRAFGVATLVLNEVGRYGRAYQNYASEMDLAASGARGETDLQRQFKAQTGLADTIEGSNPFSQLGGFIREAITGDRAAAARTMQEGEQGNRRADLTGNSVVFNRAANLQAYIVEARGGYENITRSAEVTLWQQQDKANQIRDALIGAGAEGIAHTFIVGADAALRRVHAQTRADALTRRTADVGLIARGIESANLRDAGLTDLADANDVRAQWEHQAAVELDPFLKEQYQIQGQAAYNATRTGQQRARLYHAVDLQADARIARFGLRDDPVGVTIQRLRDERDKVTDEKRNPQATDDERRAANEKFAADRLLALRDDARGKGNISDSLDVSARSLGYAINYQPFSAQTSGSAGDAIIEANKLKQAGDPANAAKRLQVGILQQQAFRAQVFESFEAQEVSDPTQIAFSGPRRGEDTPQKLDTINQNLSRIYDALTGNGPTPTGAQTGP